MPTYRSLNACGFCTAITAASVLGLGAAANAAPLALLLSGSSDRTVQLVDHTPHCKPGSHHPGGAADRAAKKAAQQRSQNAAKKVSPQPVAEVNKTPVQPTTAPQDTRGMEKATVGAQMPSAQAPTDDKPKALAAEGAPVPR